MQRHEELLLENKAWSIEMDQRYPGFFKRISKGQEPEFLWIGCADSRVSPSEITQSKPGQLFIHRNVANLVVPGDINLLSVLQYAVEVLKIKHVIVCGHYGCGGVKTAMSDVSLGLIDSWLGNIKEVIGKHEDELDAIADETERCNRLVELNVREQLMHLAATSIIQTSWKKAQIPVLHGWVFNIADGIIRQHYQMQPGSKMPMDISQSPIAALA
jgi:carbonic anhydrase